MGNPCPASAQGSMPPSHNGATSPNSKKRKRADYIDCPIHCYHLIDRPPSLVPRNHPSLHLPSVGHCPLRLRYASQQSLPRHGDISYTVQNNDFPQNSLIQPVPVQVNRPAVQNNDFLQNTLIPPAPVLGKRPKVLQNDFLQNPLIPPVPVQVNRPAVQNDGFSQNPLIPPVPRGIQGNSTANLIYYNDFPQNPLSAPVPRGIQGNSTANLIYNNDFPQNPLSAPVPRGIQGNSTANLIYYNDFPPNLLSAPVHGGIQGNSTANLIYYNDFPQNPLSAPVPRGIQGNSTANLIYYNDFPQNPLIPPVPVQVNRPAVQNNDFQNPLIPPAPVLGKRPKVLHNDFPQNPLIPPVPRGIQGNRPVVLNNDFPQNPLIPPVPRGIQGNRPVVLNNDFSQNPLIAPDPVQGNSSSTADKHQFDVPSNEIPLDKTFIGAGQDDWLADWPADKEPSQNDNGYLSEDNQSEDNHVQPYGFQMNQDWEGPQEFPLGAEIPAPPSPALEAPQPLALPAPPVVVPHAHQRIQICKVPGCNQPTRAQTKRSSKCRDHLENPPPRSREAALSQSIATGQGYCSGCNGLRPRRAPGKNCWECFCKNRRQNFGVCDGCPGSRCPNRVVQDA